MNKKIVRTIVALSVGFASMTWAPAQDEDSEGKKPAPKTPPVSKLKTQEKKRAAKAKADAEAKARAIDINHASREELKKLPGMTEAYVNLVIAARPYKSKAELVTKNAMPLDYYQTIRKLVAVK